MSKKSESDQKLADDANARAQGDKQAREDSAGRGQQTVVGERGGQNAVEKERERKERETADNANKPTDQKARLDRDVGRIQDQVARNQEDGKEQGDVTYADASGERQPTTVHPDGTTTTQSQPPTQQHAPRSLAEGAVHPHGETP